jgi:hypothetical protein
LFGTQKGRIWDQITHFNTSGISSRAGLAYMADGFTFLAVSADAFVVELDVYIQARSDGEEVSSFQFQVFICAA